MDIVLFKCTVHLSYPEHRSCDKMCNRQHPFRRRVTLFRCGFNLNLCKELTLMPVDVVTFSGMTGYLQFTHKNVFKK